MVVGPWFWRGASMRREDAHEWAEHLEDMLQLCARIRRFQWGLVAEDMRHYVACVANSGFQDELPEKEVITEEFVRKMWTRRDALACISFETHLSEGSRSTPGNVLPAPARPPSSAVDGLALERMLAPLERLTSRPQ